MKKKGKGKPRGMNYADLLKARRDRLQLAMDEAALWNVGEQDENGIYHETNKTHFDYNVTSAITQKNKSNGEVKEMLKLRCVDGQLELRDLDENTLFDIVEGGVQDGAQPDRDGTPG